MLSPMTLPKDTPMLPDIVHNPQARRFELKKDGHTAFLTYSVHNAHTLAFEHTIVPPEIGGQGIGSALVKYALDYAREVGKKVIPECSMVEHYINKHPEYGNLVV